MTRPGIRWTNATVSDEDPTGTQQIMTLMVGEATLALITWFSPKGPFYLWVHGHRHGGIEGLTDARRFAERYIEHGNACPNCGMLRLPGQKCRNDAYVDPRPRPEGWPSR